MMSNSRVSTPPYPDVKQVNDERWVPPLPDASKPTVQVRLCLGCGGVHGSVNVEMNCLRSSLLQAREDAKMSEEVRRAGEALLALRKSVAETQALPHSKDGSIASRLKPGKRNPESFAQG